MKASTPRIYRSLGAIAGALAKTGIGKQHRNRISGYAFRSIDDIYNVLGPLFVRNRVSLFPHTLERHQSELRGPAGELLFSVWVRARFEFVSWWDSSSHSVESFGEAMDTGDKATAKAMAAAYKTAVIQSFCIPVAGEQDADATTFTQVTLASEQPEQGWSGWGSGVSADISLCETIEALSSLKTRVTPQLRSLSRVDPNLYSRLGAELQQRREVLSTLHSAAA